MSIISRVSLPEGFFDITSDKLLVQPEPQYVLARMWKSAMAADLAVPGQMGLAGREVPNAGANYAGIDQGRLQLAGMIMSETIAAKVDMNGLPGHTIRLNRPKFTDSTYTLASRKITPDQSISTTGIALSSEQVALTLATYAGPYSGSAVAPYAISAADANLGVHKLASMVGLHLRRDFDKFVESVLVSLLVNGASTTLYPTGFSAANDFPATGSGPMDLKTINRASATMDQANVPTFSDGFRAILMTPLQAQQLKDDPQYARASAFMPEYNSLMPGYLGSINKMHVFQLSTLDITNNSSSVPVHTAHVIAPGVLGAGMGRRPQVAFSTNDNYGETALVIWKADLAFELFDSRFVLNIKTSA